MGNDASSPEGDDDYPDEFAKFEGVETLGYRVLGVQPESPAAKAGLVSFLDFLVGANGRMLLGACLHDARPSSSRGVACDCARKNDFSAGSPPSSIEKWRDGTRAPEDVLV